MAVGTTGSKELSAQARESWVCGKVSHGHMYGQDVRTITQERHDFFI